MVQFINVALLPTGMKIIVSIMYFSPSSRHLSPVYNSFIYYCERSELLIWQVHQFELGCIKLHTPYRYKVHPKLYSDWSMCTVFSLRIESTAGQRCARKSTEFASGSKIVDENKGDMEKFLVTQDSTHACILIKNRTKGFLRKESTAGQRCACKST